jgi:sensor histidine kinase regulating citrate/malate metabolism
MTSLRLVRHSLKTRITLVTLAIFVVGIWALALYASRMLREDMERMLGEQQLATVSAIASDIDDELASRIAALTITARLSVQAMQQGPVAMQALIDQRQILPTLFNGGVIAYRSDGVAIADSLPTAGRIGVNYMDIDTVAAALKEGKSDCRCRFVTPRAG